MKKPLVSVIMAVRNCQKFIKKSILSICNQTFQDFEIILYNDASTDNTMQYAMDVFGECKIYSCLIDIPDNSSIGCANGRNKAIQEARGKYIAIQDGDDISFSSRLKKEVDFLENNNHIFCVSSWATKIDDCGIYLGEMDYPPSIHRNIIKEMKKKHNPIIDPACMFRKDIFYKLGGYLNKWLLIPDFYLWVRAAIKGYKFANISEQLIYYRKHKNSITTIYQKEAIKEHILMCKDCIYKIDY